MSRELLIYKANNLIQATYKITLSEQRVILACISKVNSSKPIESSDRFELSAKEFATIFSIDEANAYDQLIEVEARLFDRKVFIAEGGELVKTRWISTVKYHKKRGSITLYFAQGITPYLSQLREKFTRYNIASISNMTSIYGIRLYEMFAQWRQRGRLTVEIATLKKQFEIENEYDRIFDFKKYVIDAALKDINANSDLIVHTPIYTKTGRNVTGIVFDFKVKTPPQTKKKPKATPPSAEPHDDLTEWVNLRKRFGDNAPIPAEIIEQLKAAGRW